MKLVILTVGIQLFFLHANAQVNTLSQKEKDAILYVREEEKLARDVYDSMFLKWNMNPFGNVRRSEQVHMDKVKTLISAYQLTDPVLQTKDATGKFVNNNLQAYYTELVQAGSSSFADALRAGAKIEELDIHDINERMAQTKDVTVLQVYAYLKAASGNHLNAFVKRLKMQGIVYQPVILSNEEYARIIESR